MNITVVSCLRTSHGGVLWVGLLSMMVAGVSSSAMAQDEDLFGRWDPPLGGYTWPLKAIHAAHLPTDRILIWEGGTTSDPPQLWNPTDGTFSEVETEVEFPLFCSGHAGLADGSLLVAGGGDGPEFAHAEAIMFLLTGLGPWNQVNSMNSTRWYPTLTSLPDGRVLATSGSTSDPVSIPQIPEIFGPLAVGPIGTLGAWSNVPNSPYKELSNYPFMFVLPQENKVFFAGPRDLSGDPPPAETWTGTLDTQTGEWTFVALSPFAGENGSAVMYEQGGDVWVLKCGGTTEGPTENETAIINLSAQTPMWETIFPGMTEPRRYHNLVLLPTGQILAIGASKNLGADPVFAAESFDPSQPVPVWTELAMMTRPRAGHSTAVLLRDGRVLGCGGEDYLPPHLSSQSAEIFSPPYLFQGARPAIGYAPTTVEYGTQFRVVMMSQAAMPTIEKVTLVRLAAVTHSFDQNQRFVPLEFEQVTDTKLRVTAPANGNIAPPGYYMIFVVSDMGIPSVGEYVRLE